MLCGLLYVRTVEYDTKAHGLFVGSKEASEGWEERQGRGRVQ